MTLLLLKHACYPILRASYTELVKEYGPTATPTQLEEIAIAKAKLQTKIHKHYETLFELVPLLANANLNPYDDPYDDPIPLPSTFSSQEVTFFGLCFMARTEAHLRIEQAHDSLER